jgi:hypothetical protein
MFRSETKKLEEPVAKSFIIRTIITAKGEATLGLKAINLKRRCKYRLEDSDTKIKYLDLR